MHMISLLQKKKIPTMCAFYSVYMANHAYRHMGNRVQYRTVTSKYGDHPV